MRKGIVTKDNNVSHQQTAFLANASIWSLQYDQVCYHLQLCCLSLALRNPKQARQKVGVSFTQVLTLKCAILSKMTGSPEILTLHSKN